MHPRKPLLTTLLLAGAASLASAQSATNWTGFYLGGNAGYAFGKSDVTTSASYSSSGYFYDGNLPALAASGNGSVKPKGFTGGITFGYNDQSGNSVYGFEMDAGVFSVKGDRSASAVYTYNSPTGYTINQTTKANYLVTMRGRAGYAIDRSLWYGTAGLAVASIKIEDTFSDTFAAAAESVSKSKVKVGWTLGGGYEYAMQNQWSFKAEVLYADFGKVSEDSDNLTAYAPPIAYPVSTFTHTANLKSEIIRVGFNYRF